MKKVIRLTESDLTRIVKRVIRESDNYRRGFASTNPKSIWVKLLPGWTETFFEPDDDYLQHLGDTLGSSVENTELHMEPGMLYKIGGGQHNMEDQRVRNYYAEYKPESNQIDIHLIDCFNKSRNDLDNVKKVSVYNPPWDKKPWHYEDKLLGFYREPNVKNKCTRSNYDGNGIIRSHFKGGFEVGNTDQRKFFEIIEM